jgi:hypothetical protein
MLLSSQHGVRSPCPPQGMAPSPALWCCLITGPYPLVATPVPPT